MSDETESDIDAMILAEEERQRNGREKEWPR